MYGRSVLNTLTHHAERGRVAAVHSQRKKLRGRVWWPNTHRTLTYRAVAPAQASNRALPRMATAPSSAGGTAEPPLLVPYRAIGLVSDGVPFAVSQLGTETFVTTAVGRAFQVYQEQKLRLAFAGPQLPRVISALCTEGELTVAASGSAAQRARS